MWRFGFEGWALAWLMVGCDAPLAGKAGGGAQVEWEVADEVDAVSVEPDVAPESVARTLCEDAVLLRFPGTPEHIVVAADGDAIVSGISYAGGRVVRYDSEHCDVVWDIVPSVVVRDMALVGDEVVLVGDGLVRLVAETGVTRSVDGIAGTLVAGDDVIWIAHRDLVRVTGSTATVVRRDVSVADLVAHGDAVFAAIGREVWRFTRTEAELVASFDDAVVGLVHDDSGDLFVTRATGRVERIGTDPWLFDLGGVTGTTRAGPDFVVVGNALDWPSADEPYSAQIGADDGYIARFAPHMAIMWTLEVIGGEGVQTVTGVGGDVVGRHWVIGWAEHEVVLGEDALAGGGGYVARRPQGPGW